MKISIVTTTLVTIQFVSISFCHSQFLKFDAKLRKVWEGLQGLKGLKGLGLERLDRLDRLKALKLEEFRGKVLNDRRIKKYGQ